MRIYEDIEQGTEEWLQLRLGKLNGTDNADLLGTAERRETLKYKIIADRLSKSISDDSENAMDRGSRLEAEARIQYELLTGYTVDEVGLCESEENEEIANSPDGLIQLEEGYTGAIEIKCLTGWKHIKSKLTNEIPKEYRGQVLQYFIVNEDLEWLDFVLYNPDLIKHQLVVIRLTKKNLQKEITEMIERQRVFLEEVKQAEQLLK